MSRGGTMVLVGGNHGTARQLVLALALLAAGAASARAIPLQETGGRTSTVGARACRDCTEQESLRRLREMLHTRLDSLRWEIEHRRLTEAERQVAARELTKTILALEAADAAAPANALMAIEAELGAQPGQRQRTVAVSVQTAYRAKGYIGVTFDGLWTSPPGSGEDNVIRFYEYPRVALVDATSPAERAGVLVGDTLIALNGDDVREREIAFGKLLIPNRRITMRVRRQGAPKDLVVTVDAVPDYYVRRMTPRAAAPAPLPPRPEAQGQMNAGTGPGVRGAAPAIIWVGNALAGARIETIGPGLARALGVDEGVLVLRTVPGTAMYIAGVRDGDVVTQVDGAKVRSVSELARVLTERNEREGRLTVVRDKRQRELTLRW